MKGDKEENKISNEDAKKFLEYFESLIQDEKITHTTGLIVKSLAFIEKNFDIESKEWADRLGTLFTESLGIPALFAKNLLSLFVKDFVKNVINENFNSQSVSEILSTKPKKE